MTINDKLNDCTVVVKAGPGGESDDNIYRYISSPLPDWVKSVDEPDYHRITKTALQAAREIVRKTGKNIILTYSLIIDL